MTSACSDSCTGGTWRALGHCLHESPHGIANLLAWGSVSHRSSNCEVSGAVWGIYSTDWKIMKRKKQLACCENYVILSVTQLELIIWYLLSIYILLILLAKEAFGGSASFSWEELLLWLWIRWGVFVLRVWLAYCCLCCVSISHHSRTVSQPRGACLFRCTCICTNSGLLGYTLCFCNKHKRRMTTATSTVGL